MFNLLSLEWKKFRKNSVVSLLALFYFLFLPAVMILLKDFKPEGAGAIGNFIPGPDTYYTFPQVWNYLGYAGNWMVFFFLGVVAIYLVTAEVNYKTQRQTIINGMPRQTYLSSKFLAIFSISLISTIYYAFVAICIGITFTEDYSFSDIFDNDYAIFRYLLMSIAYLSFATLLAVLLRKAGLAIFIYMSFALIIEPLIKVGMKFKDWILNEYANYLPLNAIEDLMPNPLYAIPDELPVGDKIDLLLSYPQAGLIAGLSTIVFLSWAWFSFMKRDL